MGSTQIVNQTAFIVSYFNHRDEITIYSQKQNLLALADEELRNDGDVK